MSVVVEQLTKCYGTQKALDAISFQVKKGEILGFLGPNGAGKSTTMKIITGYLPPTSGKVTVNGTDVSEENLSVKRQIGYLPENNPLYGEMYVKEYLDFCAQLHKVRQPTNRINEIIRITGLEPEKHKKIVQLSKGFRQRVGLAQALLHDPEILILDEPTSGLDPNQLFEIRALIKELGKNKTVIFSSHIMQEVQAVADRIIIINKGKIIADDTPEALQARTRHRVSIRVEFKQPVSRQHLLSIKGISDAQLSGNAWLLMSEENRDVREDIFLFAASEGLTILEMYREKYSLEEVFQQLTANKQ